MTEHLTIRQAARRMALSDQTVRDLCQRGELAGAFQEHERGPWRIPVESVDAWIEAGIIRRRTRRRNITIAGIGTILAIIFAFVSGLADWDKAVLQLQQWGILRSYPSAAEGETLVIVFDFSITENVMDTDIAGEISRAIQAEANNYNLKNIRVVTDSRKINPQDKEKAQKIGLANNAAIVIWGEDSGIRVTVRFLNIKNPNLPLSDERIDETQYSQLADPSAYAVFITQNLPQQLTTLSLFALGQSLLIEGKVDDAISMLETCTKSIDQDSTFEGEVIAYQYIGWLYTQKSDYDPALAALTKSIMLDPDNNYGGYVNRGVLFGTFLKYPEAYDDFNKAISIDTQEKLAYYNRGLTYAYEQKYPQAIEDFSKIIDDIDPNYEWAYYSRGLALVYSNADDEGAIKDFSKAIEINPRFWLAYQNRAAIYLEIGNNEGAIEDTTAILDEYPDIQMTLAVRSFAYSRSGKIDEAIADMTKILEIQPRNATWYHNRALVYQTMGKIPEAINDYENCIEYADDTNLKNLCETSLTELKKP